jgi:thiosulfate/3-mercaptopyruvate sulfurtransferase
MEKLVSTEWLSDALGKPGLRIVDASWHMPGDGRDARADYDAGHIPGAVFLELGTLADPNSNLPLMLPDAASFAARMEALGIGDGQDIVLYDNSPFRTAARAWWMLAQVFGVQRVAILDGGYQKWAAEGRPVETALPSFEPATFTARFNARALRNKADLLTNLESQVEQVLDARGAPRFAGEEAESRPNLVAGHIPGSRNLPYGQMFDSNGCWKRGDDLRAAFLAAGIDMDRPIVTTCGSGVTASILTFGAHLLGKHDVALYDGSWTDWGSDPATPKATGRA